MPQPVLAVVSVLGKDQKGVVAQFATYMAERGINIEDIEQRVVRGFFVMDMLVDLKTSPPIFPSSSPACSISAARSTWRSKSTSIPKRKKKNRRSRQQRTPLPRAAPRRSPRRQTPRRNRRRLCQSPRSGTHRQSRQSALCLPSAITISKNISTGCAQSATPGIDPIVLARYMRILPPQLRQDVPSSDHQHPSVAAPLFPRRGPLQTGIRKRRARARLHRPLRHRTTRRRPRHPSGRLPHQCRHRLTGRRQAERPGTGSAEPSAEPCSYSSMKNWWWSKAKSSSSRASAGFLVLRSRLVARAFSPCKD